MKQRWYWWIAAIAALWFAVERFAEIKKVATTFAHGRWQWVVLALIVEIGYYSVLVLIYQASFEITGIKRRFLDMIPPVLGSIFINVLAPTAGTAGVALLADDARRRGESPARAAAAALLAWVVDYGVFLLFLFVGLFVIAGQNELKQYEIIAALIFALITLVLAGSLLLARYREKLLRLILTIAQRLINYTAKSFRIAEPFSHDWVEKNVGELTAAAHAIAQKPNKLWRAGGLALLLHCTNTLALFLLFLAFYHPISLGVAIAGYAAIILFWVVSPTPQGIGIVESVSVIVFISLGVPGGVATAIVLAFRGIAFWLPLLVGFVMLRRVRSFSDEEQSISEVWGVRVSAVLVALMGLINIVSATTPALAYRISSIAHFSPFEIHYGARLTALLSGFALLVISQNLWRRKYSAWVLAEIVLLLSVVSHLLKGLDFAEAVIAMTLAVWLFFLRSHFHAQSDRPSLLQGFRLLVVSVLFTLSYGILGFYLLDRHFSVNFSMVAAVHQTLIMFTQFYNPGLEPITGFGRYFADSIYVVGAVTIGYSLFAILRPVLLRRHPNKRDLAKAEEIVGRYGRSAIARFTLFDDKYFYFSSSGTFISYIVKGRIAIVLGDPIGPKTDVSRAIESFVRYCEKHDWVPAFYQTREEYLEIYSQAGFSNLCIGHEAVVNLSDFTLAGGENKPIRTPVNRMNGLGFASHVYDKNIPERIISELEVVSDEWLTANGGIEKRFSLGWFDRQYLKDTIVSTVVSANGLLTAFANFVPMYQEKGIALDLFRRRPAVENGTNEFLLVSVIEWAKQAGYETLSLGLSPLAGVGSGSQDKMIERALGFIFNHLNMIYNYKGLHAFKDKFNPEWQPRYLVYKGAANLLPATMAVLRADSGDGFIWEKIKNKIR